MTEGYKKKPRGAKKIRGDRDSAHRTLFEHNRKIIIATQSVCGICGKPVDKTIKYPDPMSPTVDHIIPLSKGGDPVAIENLQLAHRYCNRMKSDKLPSKPTIQDENRKLPLTENWAEF